PWGDKFSSSLVVSRSDSGWLTCSRALCKEQLVSGVIVIVSNLHEGKARETKPQRLFRPRGFYIERTSKKEEKHIVFIQRFPNQLQVIMMGSNKVSRKSSFGKPKTPRLGISGIDYVNGLANHGYNHFHNGGASAGKSNGSQPQLQSIEVQHLPSHLHHQNVQNLDAINKTNSVDRGCKLKRKKSQPFEPSYYFDSDFDSDGGGGRRRSSTLNCSPSIVSRFLRLSRRKSSTSSSKKRQNQEEAYGSGGDGRGSKDQPQQKNPDVPCQTQTQSKRLSEDQQYGGGFRGGLGSNNNNNRIYPQEELPSDAGQQSHPPHHHHLHTHSLPQQHQHQAQQPHQSNDIDGEKTSASTASPETNNGKGLLSPLRERLAAIEELTTSLQSWQLTEKTEYEKCVSDLANQVSRAVALQQLMKSEVEKLQQRVVDLENHNKAMATMIIPTLVRKIYRYTSIHKKRTRTEQILLFVDEKCALICIPPGVFFSLRTFITT
ncbi:Nck-associated protein 5, partial [Orchesella cincta]